MPARGVDELNIDAHAAVAALHAAFEHVADIEFASDLRNVVGLALVGEGGIAGDDERAGEPGEVGGEALGHSFHEVLLLRIAPDVCER